jgi:hypothetical protein
MHLYWMCTCIRVAISNMGALGAVDFQEHEMNHGAITVRRPFEVARRMVTGGGGDVSDTSR